MLLPCSPGGFAPAAPSGAPPPTSNPCLRQVNKGTAGAGRVTSTLPTDGTILTGSTKPGYEMSRVLFSVSCCDLLLLLMRVKSRDLSPFLKKHHIVVRPQLSQLKISFAMSSGDCTIMMPHIHAPRRASSANSDHHPGGL